ncbi:hypothetical protein NC653_017284 [Populus alba x Populus x berolinensis]|uniref:Uncharacterized protein n=1 Tax=Populus alba x Populus x berolinensis TaxID=444605 RepID=A0AAD6W094_9ROSI|nr:hypothetical protein NC653_017284 [Populus alba x Populus x berolinensis]
MACFSFTTGLHDKSFAFRDALKSFIQGYQELRCSAGHGNERRI